MPTLSAFIPERLTAVRTCLNLNMAQAARLVRLTKMGYGRYEHGERTPSIQTIQYMAQKLGTSVEYLCGQTDDPSPLEVTVSQADNPALFSLVIELQKAPPESISRLLAYYQKLKDSIG